MTELMRISTQLLSIASQRLESAARNIANATTAGYKREVSFAEQLGMAGRGMPALRVASDFLQGKLVNSGNPLDLALASSGFFVLRNESGGAGVEYARAGRFVLDASGRVTSAQGQALQGTGGDIVVRGAQWRVTHDGTVLDNGMPVDRLLIVDFAEPARLVRSHAGFTAGADPREVERPTVVQGSYEAPNVSSADDMLRLMAALREAEGGQRVVRAYDEMLGTVLQRIGEIS